MDNTIQTNISTAINAYVQTVNNNKTSAPQDSNVKISQVQQKTQENQQILYDLYKPSKNVDNFVSGTTEISRNYKTDDVVIRVFNQQKTLVSQQPPVIYLKSKELNMMNGKLFNIKA
jgi:hypothetical protein